MTIKSALFLPIALAAASASAAASEPAVADSLTATISALDRAVFDAFNRCGDSGQLQKHAGYFAADVEFYHDNGGVTWTRDAMLDNTRKHACGRYSRELIPGTLKVYPIRDFGALSTGAHRFCQAGSGRCEGIADFTMIWRLRNGEWEITRVLSYGHRVAAGE